MVYVVCLRDYQTMLAGLAAPEHKLKHKVTSN